jgi:uncharacterized membrane protein YgaE (UPF0421/DUF939 family)
VKPRTTALLDTAAERSRVTVRTRLARLWAVLPAVTQTAVAAAIAFSLAKDVVGHRAPFVAPISAIIALGITYGQRTTRAVEIVLGVAVGVLVADAITISLGTGPLQIALVISLAMAAAVMLGGTRLVVSQSATSAALVATVAVPSHVSLARPIDSLIGGVMALFVNLVVAPVNPVRLAHRAGSPLLVELGAVLRDIATALGHDDHDAAVDALARARHLDALMAAFTESAQVGDEVASLSPRRRRHRADLQVYVRLAEQLDLAVRNVRVLARGAIRAIDLQAGVPEETLVALRDLASATIALAPDPLNAARAARARAHALDAAGRATLGLERTANLSASVIVGQVRSIATDVVKALGATDGEAVDAVRAAVRELAGKELLDDA